MCEIRRCSEMKDYRDWRGIIERGWKCPDNGYIPDKEWNRGNKVLYWAVVLGSVVLLAWRALCYKT